MIIATHGIVASQIASYAFLLDLYPSAAAAYSVRKLRSAYTGSAIRVRRSSDNTEQDIGFVNNVLDTSSLTSFCGSGNGFVTTWYDQSSNGYNATQTTAANQPQIVSSGSVILDNSKPAIKFDGDNDFFENTTNILATSNPACSLFLSAKKLNFSTSTNQGAASLGIGSVSTNYFYIPIRPNGTTNEIQFRASGDSNSRSYNTGDNFTNNVLNLYNSIDDGSNVTIYQNSNEILASSATAIGTFNPATNVGFRIGHVSPSALSYWNGNMSEIIVYTSSQSSNRTGISTNINSYYGIY